VEVWGGAKVAVALVEVLEAETAVAATVAVWGAARAAVAWAAAKAVA
jgi:hypothetical protein